MSISISGNGVITGATTSYSFDQSVSIGGTLTYEDVTNIDSVGVITARSGINIPADIGPTIKFENQHSVTNDAVISTFDDANGTLLSVGSNFYFNSGGSETRYNTSEESCAIVLNRTGDITLKTGGTGATAVTRLGIGTGGMVQIGGDVAVQSNLDSVNTKVTIKQSGFSMNSGIYMERPGENRGYYTRIATVNAAQDALVFAANNAGTTYDQVLSLDRVGNVAMMVGGVGIGTDVVLEKVTITQPGKIQWVSSVGNRKQGIDCTSSDHLDIYTSSDSLAARFNQVGCLNLGGGSGIVGGPTSGDFSIDIGGLRQVVGSAWRQVAILVYYVGIDGDQSDSNVFLCSCRIRGLSTWSVLNTTDIIGTAGVTISNSTNNSCRLTFNVIDTNAGSVLCMLNGGSGTDAYSTTVVVNS